MKKQVFKTPRRGWLGNTPIGSDYMEEVNERARRMKAAIRDALTEEEPLTLDGGELVWPLLPALDRRHQLRAQAPRRGQVRLIQRRRRMHRADILGAGHQRV